MCPMATFTFSPMLTVFQDAQLQQEMEQRGFVVVPFYKEAEVEELRSIFGHQHSGDVQGFFSSTFSLDTAYREKANDAIIRIGQRRMDELLVDYKVWCGSFLVKASDENSALSVHQDMTLVDESRFAGFNIWCPLLDLNEENGPLMVLPGSHRIVPTLRGSTIPGIYEDTHELIFQLMETLYVKAGTAVIFDQSIIHASPPNRSGKLRVVTNTFFTHPDARIQTCYHDKEKGMIEVFEQEDSFMTEYINFGQDIHARPSIGQSKGFVSYDFPKLTKEQLASRYPLPKKKSKGLRRILQDFLNI
jgi:hypothetical protein